MYLADYHTHTRVSPDADCSMMEFMQRNGRHGETLEESFLRLEKEARS